MSDHRTRPKSLGKTALSSSLDLSLTDELQDFVNQHSGDGTRYATPSEFICDILRKRMLHFDAEKLREGILDGIQDVVEGRLHEYSGNLKESMKRN